MENMNQGSSWYEVQIELEVYKFNYLKKPAKSSLSASEADFSVI